MCGECAVLKPTQEDIKRHQSSVCAAIWRNVSIKVPHCAKIGLFLDLPIYSLIGNVRDVIYWG